MIRKHALVVVVHDFERPINVMGYDKAQGMLAVNMKTVTAALAYNDPSTGEVIIIIAYQAVLIPHLEVNLVCPMQVRMNDVRLDKVPKFLTKNHTSHNHAIHFSQEEITVPMSLHGVTSYFPTRKSTLQEYYQMKYDVVERFTDVSATKHM